MKTIQNIFDRFWDDYTQQNPLALNIFKFFSKEGEQVVHDHIALRTFNIGDIGLPKVVKFFEGFGYTKKGDYLFEKKHLIGNHLEHPDNNLPKIFISELIVEHFSDSFQEIIKNICTQIPQPLIDNGTFIYSQRLWEQPSFNIYNALRKESEYAAWVYVHGYRANHFAIYVNALQKYNDIRKVNDFVKSKGYLMNIVKGLETYGSATELLEQSSTKAEITHIDFIEGTFAVPSCFYEFTQRYADKEGLEYNGFIAASADKIFQSTDFYTKE